MAECDDVFNPFVAVAKGKTGVVLMALGTLIDKDGQDTDNYVAVYCSETKTYSELYYEELYHQQGSTRWIYDCVVEASRASVMSQVSRITRKALTDYQVAELLETAAELYEDSVRKR